jgi:mannose-6-phosphate isomerase
MSIQMGSPNNNDMYPLRFYPIFRRYLWGGRRLGEVLKKPIGDAACAESWEIVDHDADQSVVEFGALAGNSLGELVRNRGDELLGAKIARQVASSDLPAQLRNRFPLLLKFLDADRSLSIQVHPDDQLAATLDPPDLGKTEAWYVLHADPGARIYAGLNKGITEPTFREAIQHGFTADALHRFEPKSGDCILIQAGTVHAIGAGILLAEIQQCSDTTFRIFDWNRVDDQGQPRPLHIEQGVRAIDFQRGPVQPMPPQPADRQDCVTLVECDKFAMRKWSLIEPHQTVSVGGDDRFRILAVTRGSAIVENDPSGLPLALGQTMLLPAAIGRTGVSTNGACDFLEIYIPDTSS